MKVICKTKTAHNLDLHEVTTLHANEYDYELIVDKEYIVMGIAIYKESNCPYYLIDENGRPDWFPYPLFTVSDKSLPNNWYITVHNKQSIGDIFLLMGFNELCNDNDFHDLLIERDKDAIKTYFARKASY